MIRFFLVLFLPFLLFAQKPDLLLLKSYKDGLHVEGWLMSEKLDGVRAYWDGKNLISRGGHEFKTPLWFTENFPPFEIDGELWSKRGAFENISSIVRKQKPHKGWEQLTYNIFEVPNQKGGLLSRLSVLEEYLNKHPSNYIKILKQSTCRDESHLKSFLKKVEGKGGEGIVVRDGDTPYISKRTSKALKVKSFDDAECEIVGFKNGKGKYEGKVGSFTCKQKNGQIIHIGSGLSDALRENPPAIGTNITFKYNGLTKYRKPRFPVYMRVREDTK
jgi:DNA ligase-1